MLYINRLSLYKQTEHFCEVAGTAMYLDNREFLHVELHTNEHSYTCTQMQFTSQSCNTYRVTSATLYTDIHRDSVTGCVSTLAVVSVASLTIPMQPVDTSLQIGLHAL